MLWRYPTEEAQIMKLFSFERTNGHKKSVYFIDKEEKCQKIMKLLRRRKKKECSQILCLTLRVFWSQQECSQFFVIDSWR